MFDKYLKDNLAAKQASRRYCYHTFNTYKLFIAVQAAGAAEAVYPCVCKIIPTAIFNKRDPIVVGLDVVEGKLKVGTPLCVKLPAGSRIQTGEDDDAVQV